MRLFIDGLLDWRERDDVAVTFLPERGAPVRLTGRQLIARAGGVATRLRRGEAALILCAPGPDFVVAMVGSLLAGAVAVPAYPPAMGNRRRALARLRAVLSDIQPMATLCTTDQLPALAEVEGLPGTLQVDTLAPSPDFEPAPVPADAICVLQYTSGSTSAPRGVRLSHGNLSHNIARIASEVDHAGHPPVGCSWVPPYHDMGLIGGHLYPLSTGAPIVVLPPETVLAHPRRWFEAIARYGVTNTCAPPFALQRCVDKLTPDGTPDLSGLGTLIVGSEPIPARTLSAFTTAFAPCGLDPTVVRPAYGLAESTVWVSGVPVGERPKVRDGVVSCGRFREELRIVGPDGQPAADGESGEIWLRGPSVGHGYQGHPGGPFDHELPGHGGGWLRTGDLGCVRDGEVYVHGRVKDVITQRGLQHHAHDLEQTLGLACADLDPSRIAAFADLRPGERERAVVLVELPVPTPDHVSTLRQALAEHHALEDAHLAFVRPGSIRWTTSGKKARGATRSAWQAGALVACDVVRPQRPVRASNGLYPRLSEHADALDARSLRYRYDLDTDLPWHLAAAPGVHMPEALTSFLYAELRPLLDDPARRDFVQWALGLATCEVIAWMESSVVDFVHHQSHAIEGQRASLIAMVDEEHKHMAMFRRYAQHLRTCRPDVIPAYEQSLGEAIARVPPPSQRGDKPVEWHFAAWVRLLIFEEWSVWLHARLKGEPDVQPLWAALHKVHAREEIQHVRTDAAWLDGLELDASTRQQRIRGLPLDVMRRLQVINHTVRALCLQRWPGLHLDQPDPARPLVALLRDPAFRYTRAIAPGLVRVVERGLPLQGAPPRVRRVPSTDEALAWLEAWALRQGREVFDPDASFAELGMDSVQRLDLIGALDAWLDGELAATLTYELPTPRLLAEHLASLTPRAPTPQTQPPAREAAPVTIRQARWLDGVGPRGRCHNVVGAWLAPPGTSPSSLLDALRTVAAAHPALTRRFERRPAGWWQVRHPGSADVDTEPCGQELVPTLRRRVRELSASPWHPDRSPTFRARVLSRDGRCGLVWSAPHVVADGGARLVLIQSLDDALRGRSLAPPDPAELALQAASGTSSPEREARRRWWGVELADLAPTPAPARTFAGRALRRGVSAARATRWLHARTETPFVQLLSAYARAWQATRGREAVIGTQLAARSTPRRRQMFGYLNEVVVVRPRLSADLDTVEAAARAGRAWERGVQQLLPVDDLVLHHFPERWGQRWLPAPVSFNYVPPIGSDTVPAGWTRVLAPVQERSFLFYEEMLLVQEHTDGRLGLTCWYDADTVGEAAASATLDAFEQILDRSPLQAAMAGGAP